MRFVLAFSSFFRLLFGAKLNPKVLAYLPESSRPKLEAAPGSEPGEVDAGESAPDEPASATEPAPAKSRPAPSSGSDRTRHHREGALAMLSLLQREGRLVDFLQEGIDDYGDDEIGAAVRDIHRGCAKVLSEFLTLEAVMPGEEDEDVKVPRGFDPSEVRLVGEVSGEPPFAGVLRHHGWRVTRAELPTLSEGVDRHVLAPAEVEIGAG